jgi:hypothetical protein
MGLFLPCFRKSLFSLLGLFLTLLVSGQSQDTLFYEGFENSGSSIPSGWTNAYQAGTENWKIGVGAGTFTSGQVGIPDTAAFGQYNAYFRVPSPTPHITRLVTPPINLQFAVHPELSFWHAQYPRNGNHSKLVVYYAETPTGPWYPLANYQNPVYEWTHRVFQLPSGIPTLYLAFEGHSGGGTPGSVCIDEVTIIEMGEMPRFLSAVNTSLPTTAFVPTGSQNNPVLRTEFAVMGNTGSVTLEKYTVKSLNTSDNDLAPQGVKLWFTEGENFLDPLLLASGKDFVNGTVVFENINHNLPTGYSYAWVTFDIAENATHGHYVEAYLPAGGLQVSGESWPSSDQNPLGKREIRRTLFHDNFETDKGWILSGEWQREVPQGLGGYNSGQSQTEGPAGASYAFSGTKVLGTDITGLGDFPGNYEPNLAPFAYRAIMPAQDFFYFNNITLSFQRWLNVYFFDRATIDVSTDGGLTWSQVWQNHMVNNATGWSQVSYPVPQAARHEEVLFRFTLGETGGTNLQSGWNIDDLVITGTYVTTDVGVAQWLTPQSNCDLTGAEVVSVVVKNYGAAPSPDVIPMAFSIDGGATWARDTLYGSIPVDGQQEFTFTPTADFSLPGRYNNVLVKTEMPGDQDPTNDQLHTRVFAVPSYHTPYEEDFVANDGYWTAYGTNNSWQRTLPNATVINGAHTGNLAWVTNASGFYNASEFSWVESPCFDLTGIENPVLDFFVKTHTLPGLDGVALDYSLDGGFTWERVQATSPELAWDWYNSYTINSLSQATGNGSGWTGTSEGWINPRVVLPAETANHPAVRFRLVFATNPVAVEYEGVAFDMVSVYETPNDIGVSAWISPQPGCELSAAQSVTIGIENFGINTLQAGTTLPVGVDYLNEGETYLESFVLQSPLAPGALVEYTFEQTFDLQQPGTYSFTAYTLLEEQSGFWNDDTSNDSLSVSIDVFGFPAVSIGEDLFTTQPDTLLLDAGPGFASYLWQDGSAAQTFQVSSPQTATYSVVVTDHNGCQATDSILVKTWDLSVSSLVSPTDGCQLAEGVAVKVALKNTGHDTFPAGTEIPLTLHYEGDWMEDITHVLETDLLPGSTAVASFSTIVDMLEYGEYLFVVEHYFEDAEPANNLLETNVIAYGYPLVDIGDVIYTLQPDTLVLDPGPQFAQYLWQDGSTAQTFQVTSPHTATYSVMVTDQNGCTNQDEVLVVTYDLAVVAIESPYDDCQFDAEQVITVSIFNHGVDAFDAGSTFEMQLYVDQQFISQEVVSLTQPWNPQSSKSFSFAQTVDMEIPGTYHIRVNLLEPDANPENNILETAVTSTGLPVLDTPSLVVTNEPDTVVLDAGPGHHSYLWSTGHNGQTLAVSTWGTYTITVANEIGCETSLDIEVVPEFMDFAIGGIISPGNGCQYDFINVPVVVSVTNAGNVPIPAGEQFQLIYTVESQATAMEPFSLNSELLPGEAEEHTFSEFLTLAKSTSFHFQVWLEHPDDENPDNNFFEQTVSMFPLPRPELGDTIFDATPQGNLLTLQEPYQSYLWQDGSTGSTFQITSPYSQWYQVTVTDFNGCLGTDSVLVVAYDLEVSELLSPQSHCTLSTNEQVIFSIMNHGPDTFESGHVFKVGYSLNGAPPVMNDFAISTPMAPGQERTFQFPQAVNLGGTGNFNLEVMLMQGDVNPGNNEIIEIINVPGLPQVNLGGDIYTTQVDTITLFAGDGFSGYLWQDGNTNPYFDVYQFGWHWVIVTDQYGCTGSDTLYIGQATGVEFPGQHAPEVLLYPNPASEMVTVRVDAWQGEALTLELWSQTGSLVLRRPLELNGTLEERINVASLPAGVYYIRVLNAQVSSIKKLVITHP